MTVAPEQDIAAGNGNVNAIDNLIAFRTSLNKGRTVVCGHREAAVRKDRKSGGPSNLDRQLGRRRAWHDDRIKTGVAWSVDDLNAVPGEGLKCNPVADLDRRAARGHDSGFERFQAQTRWAG